MTVCKVLHQLLSVSNCYRCTLIFFSLIRGLLLRVCPSMPDHRYNYKYVNVRGGCACVVCLSFSASDSVSILLSLPLSLSHSIHSLTNPHPPICFLFRFPSRFFPYFYFLGPEELFFLFLFFLSIICLKLFS